MKIKIKQQDLAKPHVKLAVENSPIAGKGLFARQNIAKGSVLGYVNGHTTVQNGMHVLWLNDTLGLQVICDFKYINHSQNPNVAYYDDMSVVAIANIAAGDELLHDYGSAFEAALQQTSHNS